MGRTDDPHWKRYGDPIRLEPGTTPTTRARAIRDGYAESAIVDAGEQAAFESR